MTGRRKLELHVGATGSESQVNIDGEPFACTRVVVLVDANNATYVELHGLIPEPFVIRGTLCTEDEPAV